MEITNKQVKITISFKTNELWIYDEICKHSGKGNWIKDILSEFLKGNSNSKNTISKNVKIPLLLYHLPRK